MDWTATAIDLLRALWDEGHSTAEIGRRMGVTKNAIVGKAHRLDLPARASPIRRQEAEGGQPASHRRRPPSGRGDAAASSSPSRRPATLTPPASAAAPPPAAVAAAMRVFPRAALRSCCWPIGEPGKRDFRFCGAEADPGRPYCAHHSAVAYVRVRDRRSDAA
jgi:GcrA cell cycle regulator